MTITQTAGPIVGLDPTSGPLKRPEGEAVPRNLVNLDGAVVGLVANGLGRSEDFMKALYDELGGMAELAGALPVLKSSVSIPPDPGDWSRLTTEVTVAITGFGG